MIAHSQILDVIDLYSARFPERAPVLDPLRALLADGADVTSRSEFRGHITVGAVALDAERRLLLIRHRALDRWLMPGGHLETVDRTLLGAAARELAEETGIAPDLVSVPVAWHEIPIHIDRHVIPANPSKGEPSHEHWDFRFLLHAVDHTIELQTEEVLDAAWREPSAHSEIVAAAIRAAAPLTPLSLR